MDNLIQISKLNDFLYSPKSLYFHKVYESFDTATYHSKYQTKGRLNHQSVDKKSYSNSKGILQATTIYSQKLGLIGKIDLYNQKTMTLVERKSVIKKIFPGYKAQLWAQYYCLIEMGFEVKKLEFYSMEDNKKYSLNLPTPQDYHWLVNLIEKVKNYDLSKQSKLWQEAVIDEKTIYKELYF